MYYNMKTSLRVTPHLKPNQPDPVTIKYRYAEAYPPCVALSSLPFSNSILNCRLNLHVLESHSPARLPYDRRVLLCLARAPTLVRDVSPCANRRSLNCTFLASYSTNAPTLAD